MCFLFIQESHFCGNSTVIIGVPHLDIPSIHAQTSCLSKCNYGDTRYWILDISVTVLNVHSHCSLINLCSQVHGQSGIESSSFLPAFATPDEWMYFHIISDNHCPWCEIIWCSNHNRTIVYSIVYTILTITYLLYCLLYLLLLSMVHCIYYINIYDAVFLEMLHCHHWPHLVVPCVFAWEARDWSAWDIWEHGCGGMDFPTWWKWKREGQDLDGEFAQPAGDLWLMVAFAEGFVWKLSADASSRLMGR